MRLSEGTGSFAIVGRANSDGFLSIGSFLNADRFASSCWLQNERDIALPLNVCGL